MNKTIAVLGATGSVGMQALDVAEKRGYSVDLISANSNFKEAECFARRFKPRFVAMADEYCARQLAQSLEDTSIKVLAGESGITEAIAMTSAQVVVNSILGEAGLMPSIAVIEQGKRLALANKESLVIAGDIVMAKARHAGVEIIPVDSEHSAIYQSMKAGKRSEVKSLLLTASGGPFFGKSREEIKKVTLEDTLKHPTWKMGRKITVDSATLMNKGFEIVEAAHLFNISPEKIKVLIHRESILHSAVEYIDNSIIGEFSSPDMRSCVQYAVDYPDRCEAVCEPLDLLKLGKLTFAEVDEINFPLITLAKRAMSEGGAMCAVMNAADEEAVSAFLSEKIAFWQISEVVHQAYGKCGYASRVKDLEGIIACDREARVRAREIIASIAWV